MKTIRTDQVLLGNCLMSEKRAGRELACLRDILPSSFFLGRQEDKNEFQDLFPFCWLHIPCLMWVPL